MLQKSKKYQPPKFWGIHAQPTKRMQILLGTVPFIIAIVGYMVASYLRHLDNPDDKFLPSIWQMTEAIRELAFTPDKRTGHYLFWSDTFISLVRIMTGIALASASGLLAGLNMGVFPGLRSLFKPVATFLSNIPPLALLPILLIILGVDETSKISLIFLGIFFVITLSVFLAVTSIPWETIIKAETLGASQFGVAYRVILPMIMPQFLNTVRLCLNAAWLYLIAAESIAATRGLGYRIFLVRRYLSMDIVIPYVIWMTILAYIINWAMERFISKRYPWFDAQSKGV